MSKKNKGTSKALNALKKTTTLQERKNFEAGGSVNYLGGYSPIYVGLQETIDTNPSQTSAPAVRAAITGNEGDAAGAAENAKMNEPTIEERRAALQETNAAYKAPKAEVVSTAVTADTLTDEASIEQLKTGADRVGITGPTGVVAGTTKVTEAVAADAVPVPDTIKPSTYTADMAGSVTAKAAQGVVTGPGAEAAKATLTTPAEAA